MGGVGYCGVARRVAFDWQSLADEDLSPLLFVNRSKGVIDRSRALAWTTVSVVAVPHASARACGPSRVAAPPGTLA